MATETKQTRTVTKQRSGTTTIAKQSIKYLILNPLEVGYKMHQEMYSTGN